MKKKENKTPYNILICLDGENEKQKKTFSVHSLHIYCFLSAIHVSIFKTL